MTPVDEVMRALDDMIRAGKVLYVGISDAPAWVVSWANVLADLKGWSPFVGLQVQYSLIERTIERDLLPMARALEITVTPWGPLAAGLLSGKFNKANQSDTSNKDSRIKQLEMNNLFNERNMTIAEEVSKIAGETGNSPSQVAINWVRQQGGVIIPIIGARKIEQVKDNLGCLNFKLTEAQLERLNEISKIELGFPHDFLQSEMVQNLVYGGTRESIDNHRV